MVTKNIQILQGSEAANLR